MWTGDVMKKYRTVWAYILLAKYSTTSPETSNEFLKLRKVLILSKNTRYELEKLQKPGVSDQQMEKILRKRGSDFDTIIRHHFLHKEFHEKLLYEFRKRNIEVQSVHKTDYSEEAIKWADLIVPAGGDGTFLLAASKINSRDKPIIGFNSDPQRSEGYLCLPKPYSFNLSKAVSKLVQNEFRWLFRSRIQVKLTGPGALEESGLQTDCPRSRYETLLKEETACNNDEMKLPTSKILPHLALNEVFLGESVSSQVSYFEVELPGYSRTKVKCSGLCVCTGTGSTSWNLSINRLSTHKVKRLLQIAGLLHSNEISVDNITSKFNNSLIFGPDDPRMFYTLRDQICGGVWPYPPGLPSDNFTPSVIVASKCYAANLVVDGGYSYPFNDGSTAELTSSPENSLRTLVLT